MSEDTARPTCFASTLLGTFLLIGILAPIGSSVSGTDLALHQIPTLVCLLYLVLGFRRHPYDRVSYGLIFLFMVIHTIGARYLYSNVPYDDWSEALFGFRPTEYFGHTRNHFDRFVHFVFGLWIFRPARQLVEQRTRSSYVMRALLAVAIIVTIGALYEILEWAIAVGLAPETAERYNGQQGDMWDAQKDQALALVGALIAWAVGWTVKTLKKSR